MTTLIDPAIAVQRLPKHIAIVMDGNGRWAEARHRPRTFGHHAGVQAVRQVVEACIRRSVPVLTLFAFSSENWKRPVSEVSALMDLFMRAMDREVDSLHNNGVRLRFIGDRTAFQSELAERMNRVEQRTAGNMRLMLNVAANYGGRWDIACAARSLAERLQRGEIESRQIDEAAIQAEIALHDLPEPDLFIRTGGEQRISNFLLWQLAYAELWFTEVLWPDFDAAILDQALLAFAQRERRFGRTGAQIRNAS
jgi:undecaprenyl diphosphate synthase